MLVRQAILFRYDGKVLSNDEICVTNVGSALVVDYSGVEARSERITSLYELMNCRADNIVVDRSKMCVYVRRSACPGKWGFKPFGTTSVAYANGCVCRTGLVTMNGMPWATAHYKADGKERLLIQFLVSADIYSNMFYVEAGMLFENSQVIDDDVFVGRFETEREFVLGSGVGRAQCFCDWKSGKLAYVCVNYDYVDHPVIVKDVSRVFNNHSYPNDLNRLFWLTFVNGVLTVRRRTQHGHDYVNIELPECGVMNRFSYYQEDKCSYVVYVLFDDFTDLYLSSSRKKLTVMRDVSNVLEGGASFVYKREA